LLVGNWKWKESSSFSISLRRWPCNHAMLVSHVILIWQCL
jgi:hypothetical protein